MNRRKFFKNGALFTLGTTLINPIDTFAGTPNAIDDFVVKGKKAKNIIILVSDGMSRGTLTIADQFQYRKTGKHTNWIQLYNDNKVAISSMDMSSKNSVVTDSGAASSSWGGGVRVNNGSINYNEDGSYNTPIWQKFKKAGKMAGCVTTVPITHATPAGFTAVSNKRSDMPGIAVQYLENEYDVMLGGGDKYFNAKKRPDNRDLYGDFKQKGYQVVNTRDELLKADTTKPILGVFGEEDLPYTVDRINQPKLAAEYPSLAEMTEVAINRMKKNKNGFVLQVESGKVDWAAHANDIAGLIHEQLAFDEAIKVAMDFAEKDKNTLVIITTDHGNANPGILYGSRANVEFDTLQNYTATNEFILNQIKGSDNIHRVREIVKQYNGVDLHKEDSTELLSYYTKLSTDNEGLYNYKKLPYKAISDIQKRYNSVGWLSMDHTGDYVDLAMFGPGSENLKPFMKNTDLHYFMLQAAEVENKA
ncbi:alkaline phosphatase [Flavobacterium agricola]|uniref:Alkaline phosphatase n=1 Tax=Flavobacterium agricola TaxID=2870839 RepID=A0ABY6M1F9_9FLAO|nr:alkaline phosphatase [Flavobacterium agricola]UYW02388.1 alkaline phosphatase [Flavobacterium agricola]